MKHLLYDEKYTIDGARRKLDEERKGGGLKPAARAGLDIESIRMIEKELKEIATLLEGDG